MPRPLESGVSFFAQSAPSPFVPAGSCLLGEAQETWLIYRLEADLEQFVGWVLTANDTYFPVAISDPSAWIFPTTDFNRATDRLIAIASLEDLFSQSRDLPHPR